MSDQYASASGCWLAVARSDEVSAARPLRRDALNTGLVLWRSGEGLRIFEDRCPHRGARLSDGAVHEGALVCPYHGWRYTGDGRCAWAPSHETAVPSAMCRSFAATESDGLIWVRLAEAARWRVPALGDCAASARTICGPYAIRTSGVRVVENFIDVSHLPFVHAGTLGEPNRARVAPFEVHALEGGGLRSTPIKVHQPAPAGTQSGATSLYQYMLESPLSARFEKTFENESYAVLLAVTPVQEFDTIVWLVIAHDPKHTETSIRAFQDEIMAQDTAILEGLTPQRLSLESTSHVSVASDRLADRYREWLASISFSLGADPT
jgi:phenylpropionate dioxygenase-like ring-hydroxylating dioxygenase large terminal subunit